MTDSSQPPEDIPPIVIMRNHLAKLSEFLAEETFPRGSALMRINGFRAQLVKIYGKASPVLDDFPLVEGGREQEVLREVLKVKLAIAQNIVAALESLPSTALRQTQRNRIFVGHGRSPIWRELKDFLQDRLGLPWDEFNREPTAGLATSERLQAMLDGACFAFLIMTAEEEHADATTHARPNVVHEVGLFQGHLGIRRAIVMIEEGCEEFSNIVGLTQIRFPKGDISARFEQIRRVLEREGIV